MNRSSRLWNESLRISGNAVGLLWVRCDMLDAAGVRVRAAALRHFDAEDVLTWALATFRGRVVLSVSFGGPGVVLAHMLARIDRTVPVIFLDTGLLFEETYNLRREFADRRYSSPSVQ